MLQPVAPLDRRKVVDDAAAAQVAPHPSRGCGSTVALLRCRLQTNLSPTNHDLTDMPLTLGVGFVSNLRVPTAFSTDSL